jgi:type I restriction-modification system DNA methylase subunit
MCSGRQRTTLRSSIGASEYKHVVLGLLFLKYVEDASGSAEQHYETS